MGVENICIPEVLYAEIPRAVPHSEHVISDGLLNLLFMDGLQIEVHASYIQHKSLVQNAFSGVSISVLKECCHNRTRAFAHWHSGVHNTPKESSLFVVFFFQVHRINYINEERYWNE